MTDAPSNAPQGGPDAGQPQFRLLAQYVKDMSFENPGSPDSLRAGGGAPNIDVAIEVEARSIAPDTFESSITIEARAVRENDSVIFIGELTYSGLFQLSNIPEQDQEPLLMVECPRLTFPFARRVLGDMVRDGGFPPLMLDPVDFMSLYRARKAREAAAPAVDTNGNADPAEAN